MKKLGSTLLAAVAIAAGALAGAAGPARAQYPVADAATHASLAQTNTALATANWKLNEAVAALRDIAGVMRETAANTSSSLDQLQRVAQSLADPREKASKREVRQKWLTGGQGFGQIASPADMARPVGSSWALRMNQARTDGSDVRPSLDVMADPGMAARYSRAAFGLAGPAGEDRTMVGRAQLETRRRAEMLSATYDAHGMALHSIAATSAIFRRVDRLTTIMDEAYEQGIADQLYALNMSLMSLLEESAATRALIAQDVRQRAANAMVSEPAVGSTAPQLAPRGAQAGVQWEYGLGQQNAGAPDGANTAAAMASGLTRGASASPGSFAEALDSATMPGDFASGLGGMSGVGCPYSNMSSGRLSGCSRAVMSLLLGMSGADYQTQRTVFGLMTGGLSARNLGMSGSPMSWQTLAAMYGLSGLVSCFGGGESSCSYACNRMETERLPGGRCQEGRLTEFMTEEDYSYCRQLRMSCQAERRPQFDFTSLTDAIGNLLP